MAGFPDKVNRTKVSSDLLVEKCAGADLRATKILLDMLHKLEGGAAGTPAASASSVPRDDVFAQLRAKLARLAQMHAVDLPDADWSETGDDAHLGANEDDR